MASAAGGCVVPTGIGQRRAIVSNNSGANATLDVDGNTTGVIPNLGTVTITIHQGSVITNNSAAAKTFFWYKQAPFVTANITPGTPNVGSIILVAGTDVVGTNANQYSFLDLQP